MKHLQKSEINQVKILVYDRDETLQKSEINKVRILVYDQDETFTNRVNHDV